MRPLPPALLLLAALSGTAAADIRIAAIGPMSGSYQVLGGQIRDGVTKAAADINAAGGIGGEKIVVDTEDDGCRAASATAAANRAAGRGDELVVGHVCAEAAAAAAAVYAADDILAISPAVTANSFTDRRADPIIFRLAARDDQQGPAAGIYLAKHFGTARIAILSDGSPYGKPLADAVKTALNEAGAREARSESFDPGAKDYSALAQRLLDDAIDVVFIGGYPNDVALILKALRAEGSKAVVMGGDALGTGDFTDAAGDLAEGTLFTFQPDWRLAPGAADLVAAFRADGIEPRGFVLPAYAAVQLWAAARKASGSGKGADLAAKIVEAPTPTVLGDIAFDDKGDVKLPGFAVFRWQGGSPVPAGN
jgi:branched-chain amino acid transport system substrate-binding protein